MDGSDWTQYLTSASIRKTFGVSNTTLRNWAELGKVRVVRIGGDSGKRLYNKDDIARVFSGYHPRSEEGKAVAEKARKRYCYARVSSAKQKDDLERQVAALKAQFPTHEVVTDIASGLNWKRPGFLRVLDEAVAGAVAELVVATRDRLCRFAFELVQHLVKKGGCKLVVLSQGDGSPTATATDDDAGELKDDLLAIVTCFVESNNDKRAAAHRRTDRERAARAAAEAGQESTDEDSSGEESQDDGDGDDDDDKPRHKRRAKGEQVPQAVDLSDEEAEEDH